MKNRTHKIERLLENRTHKIERLLENRTHKIERLLKLSKALDLHDSTYNKDRYNKCLKSLRLEHIDPSNDDYITARLVIKRVGSYYNAPEGYYISSDTSREYSIPRYIAMYIIIANTHLKFKQIGSLFNKNYATVCNARKVVGNLLNTDKKFKDKFNSFVREYMYEV